MASDLKGALRELCFMCSDYPSGLVYYAAGTTEPKGLPFKVKPVIESTPGEFNRQIINHTEVVASGDRSVAIGGNAQGAAIVTGDGNIIEAIKYKWIL